MVTATVLGKATPFGVCSGSSLACDNTGTNLKGVSDSRKQLVAGTDRLLKERLNLQ